MSRRTWHRVATRPLDVKHKAGNAKTLVYNQESNLLFSVTGFGVGGAVAALAGLDLGARNLVHYSHNQGMPRAFNYASVVRYDNLFQ